MLQNAVGIVKLHRRLVNSQKFVWRRQTHRAEVIWSLLLTTATALAVHSATITHHLWQQGHGRGSGRLLAIFSCGVILLKDDSWVEHTFDELLFSTFAASVAANLLLERNRSSQKIQRLWGLSDKRICLLMGPLLELIRR